MVMIWFRQDLRISDNPALQKAAQSGKILPIYILDDHLPGEHKMGEASRWWCHHSLKGLNEQLDGQLRLFKGPCDKVIQMLVSALKPKALFWNRCYEPWRIRVDAQIKQWVRKKGIQCESFNGSLLWEPWEILKKDSTPYKVFTPFYQKGCLMAMEPRLPIQHMPHCQYIEHKVQNSLTLDELELLPKIQWADTIASQWKVGEQFARKRLNQFLKEGIQNYKKGRDFPALNSVSRLSPYLHFGEISVNQIWHTVKSISQDENVQHFLRELGWREFSYYLLYHFPQLPTENLQPKFNQFKWLENESSLQSWQKGQTGIPIVDAGMRELWQTGYMHNRVRMIVGSFLVKNLRCHWHHGHSWFWDCLVDADLANNSASWQWIAGCGADAAPYFRIFNPVTQGQKFDPKGLYTQQYVPELKSMPLKYLFNPWEAPSQELAKANIKLGRDYPFPIVDLKVSRQSALEAFAHLKQGR